MVRIFHKTQKMFFFKNEELFSRTVRSFFQNQKYPTNSRSFIFSYFNFFVREGSISRIRRFCFISKTSRGVSSFLGVSRFFSRKAFGFGFFPIVAYATGVGADSRSRTGFVTQAAVFYLLTWEGTPSISKPAVSEQKKPFFYL